MVPLDAYFSRMRPRWRPWRVTKRIAVIDVHGPIVSGQMSPWMRVAVDEQVCKMLETARKRSSIAGVIVHIDSRGGGAVASDRMLHATRRLASEKPVVACMADAAASGGYMVAVGAHEIVAQPTTLTGSIGVVAARVIVGRLLDRLGIHTHVIKRGARADMLSAVRVLAADERAAVENQLHAVYRRFLDEVAAGRHMPLDKIEQLAGGRVWSGRDAATCGLVDRLGGFDDALEAVQRRIGPGAEAMQPMLMAPGRSLRLPMPLAPTAVSVAHAVLPPAVQALFALSLHASGERAWLWCGVDESDAWS
jgi:protease-4